MPSPATTALYKRIVLVLIVFVISGILLWYNRNDVFRGMAKTFDHVDTATELTIFSSSSSTNGSGYYLEECNFYKFQNYTQYGRWPTLRSSCSEEADWRGNGQRVISYSLYNNSATKSPSDQFPIYLDGILKNLGQARILYPGWSIRIYSNCELTQKFCEYACLDDITWCDVRNSSRIDKLDKTNPRLWRFMALGDPTVDIFLSRDLDSWITEREQEIVKEWLSSNFTFHCARDGYNFARAISAGTWGVKNYELGQQETRYIINQFMRRGIGKPKTMSLDEDLLEELIFRKYPSRILAYDSYTCKKYKVPSVPFPKQRKSRNTRVALEIRHKKFTALPCPIECRPDHGKNWTYC